MNTVEIVYLGIACLTVFLVTGFFTQAMSTLKSYNQQIEAATARKEKARGNKWDEQVIGVTPTWATEFKYSEEYIDYSEYDGDAFDSSEL